MIKSCRSSSACSNIDIKQGDFPKGGWFSLVTQETQTDGKLTVDSMTQTHLVYTFNQNRDTAQECINIDMIKLLKDEIALLRSELCRQLISNQKTMEVLLKQNSHYQIHQRRFDPTNSSTRQSSTSLLESSNNTNVPITIGKENTTMEVQPGN